MNGDRLPVAALGDTVTFTQQGVVMGIYIDNPPDDVVPLPDRYLVRVLTGEGPQLVSVGLHEVTAVERWGADL